jgi:hypothetical protein
MAAIFDETTRELLRLIFLSSLVPLYSSLVPLYEGTGCASEVEFRGGRGAVSSK